MELCDRWGIPHSMLLGRPVPHPGEVLWTDEDHAKQLAYVRYRRGFCGGCGQWLGDWLDKDGNELKDPPYEVVPVLRPCCEMLEDEKADRQEQGKGKRGEFLAFRLIPDLRDEPPASTGP